MGCCEKKRIKECKNKGQDRLENGEAEPFRAFLFSLQIPGSLT